MKYVIAMAGLMLCASPLHAQESQKASTKVVVTPVLSAVTTSAGQPITFPKKDGQVIASIYDIPPGITLPVHEHPFPRLGYVLAGTLSVTNAETGKVENYKSGELISESIGQWHKGTNPGSEMLKLLVIDLVDQGANNTVVKE